MKENAGQPRFARVAVACPEPGPIGTAAGAVRPVGNIGRDMRREQAGGDDPARPAGYVSLAVFCPGCPMLPAVALVATIALALGGADGARAQLQLPGAVAPTPQGGATPSSRPAAPRTPGAEQPGGAIPRNVAASGLRRWEEVLPGRTLRFLGQQGSMVISRAGAGYTIAVTGVGRRGNDLRNICTPDLNGGQTVTLKPAGRPLGMQRFEAAFPGCNMVVDLLQDVAFVSAPDGACRFADDCVVDPTGLWGPGDREIPADREIERARGVAERRLNDARRILQARLRTTPEGRTFLQEQAAFPANRERLCRNYATSDIGPGFCQLKFTEARAETLAARLGVSSDAPPPAARRPRPRTDPAQAPAPAPPLR